MEHLFTKFIATLLLLIAAAATTTASAHIANVGYANAGATSNNVAAFGAQNIIGRAADAVAKAIGAAVNSSKVGSSPAGGHIMTRQEKEFLDAHNKVRAHTGLPPLKWDAKAAAFARNYAKNRSGDCELRHSTGGPYGENIFWGGGGSWTPKDAVKDWVKEHRFYNKKYHSCISGKMCGHYTQLIWRDTQRVGCAEVVCEQNRGQFMICSYDPPGNYEGCRPLDKHKPALYNKKERLDKIKSILG